MTQQLSFALNNISFSFSKDRKPFFDKLSATFTPHRIHFIQGSNGVGKSTLFRILSGKLNPQELLHGEIVIGNKTITANNSEQFSAVIQQSIKVVQQQISTMIADQFTVRQNLQAALFEHYPTYQGLPTSLLYTSLLATFGISLDSTVKMLSGGQKQILAILMVLQKKAPILLLDEPTAALDPQNTKLVIEFLHKLASSLGITILIINHDKEVIEQFAPKGYFELYRAHDETRHIKMIHT